MPFKPRRKRFSRRSRVYKIRSKARSRRPSRFRSRRRGAPNLNKFSVARWGAGFYTPNQLKCVLRYTSYYEATFSSSIATLVIAGNSLHDPDITQVGGQPRGYDQLGSLYFRFYVGASKIRIRPVVNTANANVIVAIEAVPGETGASGVIEHTLERKYVSYKFVQQQSNVKVLSRYATTPGVYGLGKAAARADIFQNADEIGFSGQTPAHGSGSANPSRMWTWQVYAQNADETTSTTAAIWLEVDYYCTFWDRVTPPVS